MITFFKFVSFLCFRLLKWKKKTRPRCSFVMPIMSSQHVEREKKKENLKVYLFLQLLWLNVWCEWNWIIRNMWSNSTSFLTRVLNLLSRWLRSVIKHHIHFVLLFPLSFGLPQTGTAQVDSLHFREKIKDNATGSPQTSIYTSYGSGLHECWKVNMIGPRLCAVAL